MKPTREVVEDFYMVMYPVVYAVGRSGGPKYGAQDPRQPEGYLECEMRIQNRKP